MIKMEPVTSTEPNERLAYSVDEAAAITGLSRDLLYDQMRVGKLAYLKVGRRRIITHQHLEAFLTRTISSHAGTVATIRYPEPGSRPRVSGPPRPGIVVHNMSEDHSVSAAPWHQRRGDPSCRRQCHARD